MEHLRCNDSRLGRGETQSKRALPGADYPDTGPGVLNTVKTMTNREYLNHLLAKTVRMHGENGFSAQHLRAQLRSMDRFGEDPEEKRVSHRKPSGTAERGPPGSGGTAGPSFSLKPGKFAQAKAEGVNRTESVQAIFEAIHGSSLSARRS